MAARGRFLVEGREIGLRDGAEITDTAGVTIEALEDGEFLLADLP